MSFFSQDNPKTKEWRQTKNMNEWKRAIQFLTAGGKQVNKHRKIKRGTSWDGFGLDTSDTAYRQTLFSGSGEQSMNGDGGWDPLRHVYSLRCALLNPTLHIPAGCVDGDAALFDTPASCTAVGGLDISVVWTHCIRTFISCFKRGYFWAAFWHQLCENICNWNPIDSTPGRHYWAQGWGIIKLKAHLHFVRNAIQEQVRIHLSCRQTNMVLIKPVQNNCEHNVISHCTADLRSAAVYLHCGCSFSFLFLNGRTDHCHLVEQIFSVKKWK